MLDEQVRTKFSKCFCACYLTNKQTNMKRIVFFFWFILLSNSDMLKIETTSPRKCNKNIVCWKYLTDKNFYTNISLAFNFVHVRRDVALLYTRSLCNRRKLSILSCQLKSPEMISITINLLIFCCLYCIFFRRSLQIKKKICCCLFTRSYALCIAYHYILLLYYERYFAYMHTMPTISEKTDFTSSYHEKKGNSGVTAKNCR